MKRFAKKEKKPKQTDEPQMENETLNLKVEKSGGNEDHKEQSVCEGEAVFEGLCERLLTSLNQVQSSLSEVLDVKDELIQNNLPSFAQTRLSLCTSQLYRSVADLYTPSTELVRLVRIFSSQWEQKLFILKQLQGEHERLQRLLSLALRRVQILEARSHRDTQSQQYRNWERLFVRLMRMGPYNPSQQNDNKSGSHLIAETSPGEYGEKTHAPPLQSHEVI